MIRHTWTGALMTSLVKASRIEIKTTNDTNTPKLQVAAALAGIGTIAGIAFYYYYTSKKKKKKKKKRRKKKKKSTTRENDRFDEASLFNAQSNSDEEEAMLRALEGNERTLGPDHKDTLILVNELGMLLRAQGKLNEAEPLYRRALEGFERTLGPDHRNTWYSRGNLGIVLMKLGNKEGRPQITQVLSTLSSPPHSLPTTHPWIKKFTAALE